MSISTLYIITFVLVLIFCYALYLINNVYSTNYNNKKEEEVYKKVSRFLIPTIAISCFFICTYLVADIIQTGDEEATVTNSDNKHSFTGIYFMFMMAFILTIFNNTVLKEDNIKKYIKGKKFTITGLFMALGVGSIVFGFLDNFGLKLGTEALDNSFLAIFLSPFSTDTRFTKFKSNISENLKIVNDWTEGNKWRSIINQLLRFKDVLNELNKNGQIDIKDLLDDINEFVDKQDKKPLSIPDEILNSPHDLTKDYVRNIKDKFDMIDGSKAMLGNTFSDFIGAILGAALMNLFIYMTNYDGIYTGDDSIDESFFTKYLNAYMPFMEAFFIALGCLMPVFINIAMSRYKSNNNSNNLYCWVVIGVISLIVLVMMYLSVKGIKTMTTKEKKKSLKKTIIDIKDRLDINETDGPINTKIEEFINNV